MSDATPVHGPAKAGSIGQSPVRKRFYNQASLSPHESGFALLLDGRLAKTPAGRPLTVGSVVVAAALVGEWSNQGEHLDPAAMPLTRLVNSAVDGVSAEMAAVRAEIVRYAESDLVCYRAEGPEGLVALQETHWAPLLAFIGETFGVHFALSEGVVHVRQDSEALAVIRLALEDYDPLSLAAIHTVTTLTGSAVIALAVAARALTPEAAWTAAHVDEDWQMSQWGKDEAALERRETRWREMAAAALVLREG